MVEGSYCDLLDEARELGRMDGRFAAAFESPGTPVGDGPRCLGRTQAEFAALLWEDRPGAPAAGLELNAPAWYAAGFAEGLALGAERLRAAEWARTRRVFS
jgi:hypothetical protein